MLLCVAMSTAFGQTPPPAPTNPDNLLTPADPIGTPPGVPAYGANESVNLSDGALTTYIPLLTVPQLGGWNLQFALVHSSNGVQHQQNVTAIPEESQTGYIYYSALVYTDRMDFSNAGLQINIPKLQASTEYVGDYLWKSSLDGESQGTGVFARFCLTNFRFTDWQGNTHPFAITQSCNEGVGTPNSTLKEESTDGSFYMIDVTNLADIQVISRSGTVYHFDEPYAPFPEPFPSSPGMYGGSNTENWLNLPMAKMTDTNGNTLTYAGNVLTDTFGRKFTLSSGISYTDSNNTQESITISATETNVGDQSLGPISCSLQTSVRDYYNGLSGPQSPGGCTATAFIGDTESQVTITFPAATLGGTQRQISITLDPAQRITKIVYPTGGYTRYDYSTSGYSPWNSNVISTAPIFEVAHKYECPDPSGACSSEYVTTYTPTLVYSSSLTEMYNQQMVVTDPLGNTTTTQFSSLQPTQIAPKPTSVVKKDKNNNILWEQTTTYYPTPSLVVPTDLTFPDVVTTYLEDASPAKTTVTTYTSYKTFPGVGGIINGHGTATITTDQPTGITEKDYDGTLKRTTSQDWSTINTFTASQGHILDRPLTKTVTDNTSHALSASTTYTYDNGANTVGNLTLKSVTATNAPTANTSYVYNSYGQATSMTDPDSNLTKFGYTPQWSDTSCVTSQAPSTSPYITSVTDALTETTNYWYNSCLGTIATVQGPNPGQTSSYTYDALQRVASVAYPDGGGEKACYFDSAPNTVVSYALQATGTTLAGLPACTSTTATATGAVAKSITLDGYGRALQTAFLSDPDGVTYVNTAYDGDGNVASVSIPYRTSAQASYVTSYQYDGLNRKRFAYNPDSTSQSSSSYEEWSYAGNVVTFTDENGNQWQRTSDAQGNLTTVQEPNGSSTSPSMETDYSYDGFGNLWSVTQWGGPKNSAGSRNRSFTYDGMSRLRSSTNPETGTTTYVYDAAGNLQTKTAPAPNAAASSSLTVTTNYGYDALNRLISKTFTSDSYQTPWTCFQYGLPTTGVSGANQIGRLMNEWTQRYNAGACASAISPSGFLTARKITSYDIMGRVKQEQQCTPSNCTSTMFGLSNTYDLTGNLLTYTNGIASTPGAGSGALTLTQAFGGAGRIQSLTSSWNDSSHPPAIFGPPTASSPQYAPQGTLAGAVFGSVLNLTRSYDPRQRLTGENVVGTQVVSATPGTVAVTITGSEQSK